MPQPKSVKGMLALVGFFLLVSSDTLWPREFKQGFIVEPYTVKHVIISDSSLIHTILGEQLIDPAKVEKIKIIDVTNNGFGENDLITLLPQQTIYPLKGISDSLAQLMSGWKIERNKYIDQEVETEPDFSQYEQTQKPIFAIMGALLRALDRNYKALPIKINFQRDRRKMRFTMWGYLEDSLRYSPLEASYLTGSAQRYDLLYSVQNDTLILADTTLYDLIYIYKTLADTVFLPGENPSQ